jgi:phenylpyruvate tautomerase PptA (4-oxalocrotonate tautomerase family)
MPHVIVHALETQLAGREKELIRGLSDAVVAVYGEQFRDHVVVQLVGLPIGRWAVGGTTPDEVAPQIAFAIRERALTRPDGHQVAGLLASAVSDAVAEVLGEHHRAGILFDLVGRADDRTAIGGQLVAETAVKEPDELRDRIEIDALRAEFTDAAMMNDHERLASLFVPGGVLRIPDAGIEAVGSESIRALAQQREERFEVFVQTAHSGVVSVSGDTATGRAYLSEVIRIRGGGSHLNHAIYHDRYQRASDGWRFAERVYEIRYLDSTPLTGGPGGPSGHHP